MAEVKYTDPVADQLRQQYPSNSKINSPSAQAQPKQREKLQPVVSGKAAIQKESFGEKVKKMFVPADVKDMKSYALNQLIIPGIKSWIISMIELAFWGQTRRSSKPGQTNYSYISSSQNYQSPAPMNQKDRATHNFRNIIFESYDDAEAVIGTLLDLVERYGAATVADFYDACGQESDWASENWGWRSFQKLNSRAVRGGYVIDIQPPILLK